MKKLLLLALIITLFVGCKKESNTTTLNISFAYSYNESFAPYNDASWPLDGATVYIFKDVNFAKDSYDYLGNGVLKNKTTGAEVTYFVKKVTACYDLFELQDDTYGVVADISTLDKNNYITNWQGWSIKLPMNIPGYADNNTIKFVFGLGPRQPWDL